MRSYSLLGGAGNCECSFEASFMMFICIIRSSFPAPLLKSVLLSMPPSAFESRPHFANMKYLNFHVWKTGACHIWSSWLLYHFCTKNVPNEVWKTHSLPAPNELQRRIDFSSRFTYLYVCIWGNFLIVRCKTQLPTLAGQKRTCLQWWTTTLTNTMPVTKTFGVWWRTNHRTADIWAFPLTTTGNEDSDFSLGGQTTHVYYGMFMALL